jgi:hypothetical protein
MSWINEHKNVGRVAFLILLLVAIMGPWAYSSDGVPPPEWCSEPHILLENNRCVRLVPGAEVISFLGGAFLEMSAALASGRLSLAERGREFLVGFVFLFVLPLASTPLLILVRRSRPLRIFHLVACGLAVILGLLLAVPQLTVLPLSIPLWGLWLYIGLAIGALALELLPRAARRAGKGRNRTPFRVRRHALSRKRFPPVGSRRQPRRAESAPVAKQQMNTRVSLPGAPAVLAHIDTPGPPSVSSGSG